MSKPTCTNSPTSSSVSSSIYGRLMISGLEVGVLKRSKANEKREAHQMDSNDQLRSGCLFSETYCGGYSGEDPPLPIPNREVKLTIADGTAPPGGRVGSCHFLLRHPVRVSDGVSCFMRFGGKFDIQLSEF